MGKNAEKSAAVADWYAPLAELASRGSTAKKSATLAGLHQARKEHLGQFFTPRELVAFMWHLVGADQPPPAPESRWESPGTLRVLDNSFGSGRMFAPANPGHHKLYGVELDAALVGPVQDAAKAAGFTYNLLHGSMEEFRLRKGRADVAFINPPFSLPIDSPFAEGFACNAHGKYGPRSSSVTHRYAVAQALAWSRVVVAVVPRTFAKEAAADPFFRGRLAAAYHLPGKAFISEGAEVATSVLVWGPSAREDEHDANPAPTFQEFRLSDLAPRVCEAVRVKYNSRHNMDPEIVREGQDDARAVVTRPVTGDRSVRLCHNGRRLVLRFNCGATQGRVLNAVYRDLVGQHRSREQGRVPKGVKYEGQGALDLENYVVQEDPVDALKDFAGSIEDLGFDVTIDPGLIRYLRRRARRHEILTTPLHHTVLQGDGGLRRWLDAQTSVRGIAREEFHMFDNEGTGRTYGWGDRGLVKKGDTVELTRCKYTNRKRRGDYFWSGSHNQYAGTMETDLLRRRFDFPDFRPAPDQWVTVHRGLKHHFPKRFHEVKQIARRLGLHKWCSWNGGDDYQFHDLCEVGLCQGNVIVAWEMGLGKARLALALCYLGQGAHNLVVVEAHLVAEMVKECRAVGLPASDWQVIESPDQLDDLRRINIIAISRLKAVVDKAHPRVTYAKRLRRRVHTMIVDEAQMLRNADTDQSRAVAVVSPKRKYDLSGTPIANYPRDILPLMQHVAGDGTAHQPYGNHHPYLTPGNLKTMELSTRGVDVFRDMFVTLEWVTNEFAEDMRSGAKREVPKIKDVSGFRKMCAPRIKRRVMEEPEVAAHVHTPKATERTVEVDWDRDHRVYYYRAAQEFVEWFRRTSEYEKKQLGLIAILAKMQAVSTAANYPQAGVADLGAYGALTSKQRYAVERLKALTRQGHKTIFLCHSPAVVELMAGEMSAAGVEAMTFHGGQTIANRTKAMDHFRESDVPVLLATTGVLQTGYNVWQADRVFHYNRSWTPKVEKQANARVLRPQQTRDVEIEYAHLPGSIDDYQAQMVAFKAGSMRAGLDFGDEDPEAEFHHIETILGRFVEDFEGRVGKKFRDVVEGHKAQKQQRKAVTA